MNSTFKTVLIGLGAITAVFILSQLVMGQLIYGGRVNLITAHRHTGYTTVVLALIYVALSLRAIASLPTRPKS